jgi:hypothetical protein
MKISVYKSFQLSEFWFQLKCYQFTAKTIRPIVIPSCDSVSIGTRLGAGWPGLDSQQGQGSFLFTIAYRPAPGPTQTHIKWLPGVQWPRCESDYSPTCSAEVKNAWRCSSTPPIRFHGVVLNYVRYKSS